MLCTYIYIVKELLSVPGCEFTGFQNMNVGEAEVGTITQWGWRSAWWGIGSRSRSRPWWWGSSAPRLQVWAPASVQTDGPLHQARSSLCTLEVFHRIGHSVVPWIICMYEMALGTCVGIWIAEKWYALNIFDDGFCCWILLCIVML